MRRSTLSPLVTVTVSTENPGLPLMSTSLIFKWSVELLPHAAKATAPMPTATNERARCTGREASGPLARTLGARPRDRSQPRPRGHVLVDRPHTRQRDRLVSAPVDDGGRAPRLLRGSLPPRRGRQHLLLPADAGDGGGLGRAHARRVHDEHQGVLAADRPPDVSAFAVARPATRDPHRAPGQEIALQQAPPRRGDRGGVGPLPPRPHAVALGGQAGRRPPPVPEVVHAEGRQPGGARRRPPARARLRP